MIISIVIPVYNGEKTLRDLYNQIKREINVYKTYEIIFVYDCGKDNSWRIISELSEEDKEHVRGFHLDKNYGQQLATLFGLKRSSGDYIITLDEDVQHDPKFIQEMIKKLENEKLDFVYGKFKRIEQPVIKVFLSKLLRLILCRMVPDLPRDYSSYRLIRKELAEKLIAADSHFSFIDVELGRISQNEASLVVDHCKRINGSSSYTVSKLIKQTLDVLFGYSQIFREIYYLILVIIPSSILVLIFFAKRLSVNSSSFILIMLLILISLIWIRRNTVTRISRKLVPLVIEQLN